MDFLSTREIATLIWLILAGGLLLAKTKNLAPVMLGLTQAFFHWKIQFLLALQFGYTAFVVLLLQSLGVWNVAELEGTLLWLLLATPSAIARATQRKNQRGFWQDWAIDNLKIIVVIEFLIGQFVFSLWAELIIVPVATLLVLTTTFAGQKEAFKPIARLGNFFLAVMGLALFGNALTQLFGNLGEFASFQTLQAFYTVPLLSLLNIPFVLFVHVLTTYETQFVGLNHRIKDPALRRYAKRRAFSTFLINTELLKRWTRDIGIRPPKTRADTRFSIGEVIKRYKVEQNPPPFDSSSAGWSPYEAKKFLSEVGLSTNDYHPFYGEGWRCEGSIKTGDSVLHPTLQYRVDGNKQAATELELFMCIHTHDRDPELALRTFENAREVLMNCALNKQERAGIAQLAKPEDQYDVLTDRWIVRQTSESWGNKGNRSTDYSFKIMARDEAQFDD